MYRQCNKPLHVFLGQEDKEIDGGEGMDIIRAEIVMIEKIQVL